MSKSDISCSDAEGGGGADSRTWAPIIIKAEEVRLTRPQLPKQTDVPNWEGRPAILMLYKPQVQPPVPALS